MSASKGVIGSSFACETCSIEIVRRGAMQRFCEVCRIKRDRARTRKWTRENPPDPVKAQAWKRNRDVRLKARAAEENPGQSIGWHPTELGTDLAWHVRVAVPFTYDLSKNRMWSHTGKRNAVFMRDEIKRARQGIITRIRAAIARSGFTPVDAKVFVDIFVQKPDGRGDAVNMVDSVCDALKEAIGVDDRWFSIRGLDWEIVKSDPRIYIGVGQAETEPHIACSYCGQIRPATEYGLNRRGPHGRSRVCNTCRSLERRRT